MADEMPSQDEENPQEPVETDVIEAEKTAESGAEPAPEPAPETAPELESEAQGQDGEEVMSPEELDEARANEVAFSWQASEYVHHHKGTSWYAALFGGLALLVLVVVLLHLWLETGLFLVMGAAVVVYARKPPRTLMYELTPKGITIEGKQYPFSEFRSFGVLKDEDWHTIDLEPMKRLAPRLSILFDPQDFDSVVGHLELHLPRADRDPDPIERLSRYLRF